MYLAEGHVGVEPVVERVDGVVVDVVVRGDPAEVRRLEGLRSRVVSDHAARLQDLGCGGTGEGGGHERTKKELRRGQGLPAVFRALHPRPAACLVEPPSSASTVANNNRKGRQHLSLPALRASHATTALARHRPWRRRG